MRGPSPELSDLDIAAIEAIAPPSLLYMVQLGLGSGMRIGEMTQLRVADVAPHGRVTGTITLAARATKSGRSRTVDLTEQATHQTKLYIQGMPPDSFLFLDRYGQRWTANAAVHAIGRLFERAGVKASSHSLRRTFANRLRRAGVDLKIIQEQLGHSSLAITERYFAVDPAEKRRAIAKLRY